MQKAHKQKDACRLKHALQKAWCIALQTSCQNSPAVRKGFTLIELLIVITILGILAAALTVSLRAGFKSARQADCKTKLHQLGVAITVFRSEHDDRVPDWISNLYPEYIDDRSVYVCLADDNKGRDTPVPSLYLKKISDTGNFYTSQGTWDNERGSGPTRNKVVTLNSYCYEFSAATGTSTWYKGDPLPEHERVFNTMREYKLIQMKYGGLENKIDGVQVPYSASQIPIVRCCHHWNDQFILGTRGEGRTTLERMPLILNVAYAGNVFVSPPYWEGMARLGNKR